MFGERAHNSALFSNLSLTSLLDKCRSTIVQIMKVEAISAFKQNTFINIVIKNESSS